MKQKNKSKIIIAILILIIIIILLMFGFQNHNLNKNKNLADDGNAVSWDGRQSLPRARLQDGTAAIAIPGFDCLVFDKGSKTQKVNFYNPEINECYFQMTLLVDGEELWKSGNVKPGKGYYEIELNRTLSPMETQGCLQIRCFKNSGEELNSAKVDFKLIIN